MQPAPTVSVTDRFLILAAAPIAGAVIRRPQSTHLGIAGEPTGMPSRATLRTMRIVAG